MALVTVRVPGTAEEWPDSRFGALVSVAHTVIDGVECPIVDGRRDERGAVLIVDTGDGGPDPESGSAVGLGTVE